MSARTPTTIPAIAPALRPDPPEDGLEEAEGDAVGVAVDSGGVFSPGLSWIVEFLWKAYCVSNVCVAFCVQLVSSIASVEKTKFTGLMTPIMPLEMQADGALQ